jgi:hypothetical protein
MSAKGVAKINISRRNAARASLLNRSRDLKFEARLVVPILFFRSPPIAMAPRKKPASKSGKPKPKPKVVDTTTPQTRKDRAEVEAGTPVTHDTTTLSGGIQAEDEGDKAVDEDKDGGTSTTATKSCNPATKTTGRVKKGGKRK